MAFEVESCVAEQCLWIHLLFYPVFFSFYLLPIPRYSRFSCGPLLLRRCRLEARAKIGMRIGKRIETICQARIARILERQGDGRRGDTSRWGSRLRKSGGEEKRRMSRAREEIERRSRFLGTRRMNTDPTKRFRSFDIPNPPRSCSFCRPSAPSPSAALKRRVFARADRI
jgi:hypothetical protein